MATHNPGFITASTVSALLTGKGDTLLRGGITFCKQLALERSGIAEIYNQFSGNSATEWGNENESDAIRRYEQHQFVEVHSKQAGVRQQDSWLSCTPDGFVGSDGLVEVKCPYSEYVHLDRILEPELLVNDYNDQAQFQLMLTGRKWCDLISYHPHYDDAHCLVIVRLNADTDWQKRCLNRIEQAETIIAEILEKLS